jgi:hypothetical protein
MFQPRKYRFTGVAATLLVLPLNLLPQQPASAQAPGDPVAGAKGLIQKLIGMKKPTEMGEVFTNDSAAAMGLMMTMFVGMASAMGDMGGPGGAKSTKPNPLKSIGADLEKILPKYGLNKNMNPGSKPPAQLTKNGRKFLTEMMGLVERIPGSKGQTQGFMKNKDAPKSPDELNYTVVSPTRVKMTPKKKVAGKDETLEARFEDGKWRIHMGTIDELMKKMQQGMGGPPPGGPGGPGRPGGAPPPPRKP